MTSGVENSLWTRKRFAKALALAVGTVLGYAAKAFPAVTAPVPPALAAIKRPRHWGMVIDLDLCTGCGACSVACKVENNVPMTGNDETHQGTEIEWMSLLPGPGDSTVHRRADMLPMPCMHCGNAPCVKVCPVGATYKNEEGLTVQIWDRCIGCRYCMTACPYSRRSFNWAPPQWPDSYKNYLNPDVATRPKGVVEKCTFCYHRIRSMNEKAKVTGQPPGDEDIRYLPACAQSCPPKAIVFGDLNDPQSLAAKLSKSSRAFTLLSHLGTEPSVYYLSRNQIIDEG